MARQLDPVKIYVEGRNDLFALVNLLLRHGVDYDAKPWPAPYPKFFAAISDSDDPTRESSGVEAVLQAISDEVVAQAGRIVGFVLDADHDPNSRWAAVRDRLVPNQVVTLDNVPIEQMNAIPESGFHGISHRFGTRVGVWMMPNNRDAGKLEEFLLPLVPPTKQFLFEFAGTCTDDAKQKLSASNLEPFADADQIKAQLACWLAWQKNPGRPYGTAIRAKYFDHESETAVKFVAWFKSLYGLSS